jgi:hypothetical protein
VPRRGGWRAWGAVRADFESALADAADPAIASAEVASEFRRGRRLHPGERRAHVVTTDVADALAIAWEAFRGAARDDVTGWEVAAATAQVQPEPPLTEASDHTERRLVYDKIAATDQERADIKALARQMRMDLGSSWPGPAQHLLIEDALEKRSL